MNQVISAAGAVKHDEIFDQVRKLFTKLSQDSTTVPQLVTKNPAIFTGSEVSFSFLLNSPSKVSLLTVQLFSMASGSSTKC